MRVHAVEMVGAVLGRMWLLRKWSLSSAVVAEAVAVQRYKDMLHAALEENIIGGGYLGECVVRMRTRGSESIRSFGDARRLGAMHACMGHLGSFHPMNSHVGSLYSFRDQYRLLTPSHSSFSISGTFTVSHTVSKPASKRSISKTFV